MSIMEKLKEFIEVTSQYDGKKALIRAATIEAVTDNAEDKKRREHKIGLPYNLLRWAYDKCH